MAADQHRKRLNSANGAGSSLCDHYKLKKKKMELSAGQNPKLHISLEWDGIQCKVIARRDQVSLSKRDLRPFVNSIPQSCNHSADVFSVPQEVFKLKNLNDVLSYDVWQNCLSGNEKESLLRFLPGGPNQEKVVEELLSGENFNFGNPFLEWGAKLCSGNLHPDAVSLQEKCLIDDKRAYYTDIQKYHTDMIKYLQKLKKTCESSKDPETEVLENIWSRSRRGRKEKRSRIENRSRFHNCKDVLATTSDSLSLIEDDKACSSDNQISPLMKGRALNKRIHHNGSKENFKKQLVTSDDGRKGEVVHKSNIYQNDGAKYMSILKISKRQHDLVKHMKESGKSIQSKSLNRLLGTIDTSLLQPYEEFMKEEKKKLQEHWLQLVNMDLPAAYAKWRKGQLERGDMLMSLCQEVDDKLNSSLEDEGKDNSDMVFEDQNDEGEINLEANEEGAENLVQEIRDNREESTRETQLMIDEDAGCSFLHEQNDQDTKIQETSTETCEDIIFGSLHAISTNHASSLSGGHDLNDVDISSGSSHGMSPDHTSSLSGGHDPNDNYVEYESILESKSNNAPLPTSEFSINGNTAVPSVEPLIPFSSGENLYLRNTSCGDSTKSQGASSFGGTRSVGVADNPNPSIYQGVAFSSGRRERFPVDINDADASVGHGVPVSSTGGVYGVDMDNIDPSVMRGPPVCSGGDMYTVDGDNADTCISQGVPVSSSAAACLERSNIANSSISQGPISCGGDNWSVVNMGHSYYNSTAKEEYSSHRDGPLHHQVNGAQHTTLIDMEGETKKNPRHCDDAPFSSYPNPDGSGLLQSLFSGQEMSYQHDQKNTGLDFRSANDVLLQDGVFAEHMQGQLQSFVPTVHGKKTSGENYIRQTVTNELYPEGGGYLIPRHGHNPLTSLPEWAANQVRMQTLQPQLPNDGIASQNWLPGQHQVRGVWSDSNGTSVPSQNIGNHADQSLYSVLSQCNQLHSDRHFDSISPTEQFMLPRNYAMVSAGAPRISNALPQAPHPLTFLGGRDTGSSFVAPGDMTWMNSQSSMPHDPLGKPSLRSWNQ